MKVLVVAMLYDYGDKDRGLSYAHYYFNQPLEQIADVVISFDFMEMLRIHGRERMNRKLLNIVRRERPDITLIVPFTDQFIPDVIDEINQFTVTVGYFYDDTWRIEYSRFWARHFTYVTTSDINGIKKFRDAGYNNVIYSPFGCHPEAFTKQDLPKIYDVSFVGMHDPYRAWLLKWLKRAGIDVHMWGTDWRTGRLDHEKMVKVFNQSRINLNLSNCVSWDLRYLLSSLRRDLRYPLSLLRVVKNMLRSLKVRDSKTYEMVKARHFEINACGGFQLSYYVEGLERHYQIGEEIALYASREDLVDKVRYYLKHDDEREAIAQRGYERTLRDHTMEKRFQNLLREIGQNKYLKK